MSDQVYTIRQDGFLEIRKKRFLTSFLILFLAAAVGVSIGLVNGRPGQVNVLPIVIPLVIFALGFGIYRGMNRLKAILNSYSLTITDHLISREQLDTPTMDIYFNEIQSINKKKDGGFVIMGKYPGDVIIVPVQMDRYAEHESQLQAIRLVTAESSDSFLQRHRLATSLVTLGLFFCVYILQNAILVVTSGILLIGLVCWSFYSLRNNKNVDSKTKRMSFLIILPVLSILARMFFSVFHTI